MGLTQKVLIFACVPLGVWGVVRLLRPFGSQRAALVAGLAYLAVALPVQRAGPRPLRGPGGLRRHPLGPGPALPGHGVGTLRAAGPDRRGPVRDPGSADPAPDRAEGTARAAIHGLVPSGTRGPGAPWPSASSRRC